MVIIINEAMRSRIAVLFSGWLASVSLLVAAAPPDYVFILHDAGESNMALPPIQQLAAEGYSIAGRFGVSIGALCFN